MKQGDVLSAILFCIVIASIIAKAVEDYGTGLYICGRMLSNLTYAHDIALINQSQKELLPGLPCEVFF